MTASLHSRFSSPPAAPSSPAPLRPPVLPLTAPWESCVCKCVFECVCVCVKVCVSARARARLGVPTAHGHRHTNRHTHRHTHRHTRPPTHPLTDNPPHQQPPYPLYYYALKKASAYLRPACSPRSCLCQPTRVTSAPPPCCRRARALIALPYHLYPSWRFPCAHPAPPCR
jgi:hypothetical protein